MPAGSKGKYCPDIVEVIVAAIAVAGTDKAGYEAGGVSYDTFYTWIKKHPEFAEAVASARKEFSEFQPDHVVRQARKAFLDYLFGRVNEKWTRYETFTDEDGKTTSKEVLQIVNRGVPKWAIERVLGVVPESGALAITADDIAEPEKGLSEDQVAEIKSRVLGIAEA
jgi:hypothetical protein